MLVPSLEAERSLWERGIRRVVGVDEAGLGPLAGPVVAAACLIPMDCDMIEGVRDSKILSALQRQRLFPRILQQAAAVAWGAASVREIEDLNVLRATHLAMKRALCRIGDYDHALIDGLAIADQQMGPHTPLVDGDASSYSIACASILAKVLRDRLMKRLSARHPGYGWEQNAGYATQAHLEALRELGPTPYHRRSYAPVRLVLQQIPLPEL